MSDEGRVVKWESVTSAPSSSRKFVDTGRAYPYPFYLIIADFRGWAATGTGPKRSTEVDVLRELSLNLAT